MRHMSDFFCVRFMNSTAAIGETEFVRTFDRLRKQNLSSNTVPIGKCAYNANNGLRRITEPRAAIHSCN